MMSLLLCMALMVEGPQAARCAPADTLGYLEAPTPRATYSRAATSAFKQAARTLVPESLRKRDDVQLITLGDNGDTQRWPTPHCTPVARSLAEDLQYNHLVQAAPDADVRGRFDLQRWFTVLRHQSFGASYEQAVRRLGVHRLQSVEFNAKLTNPKQWTGDLDIFGPAPEGFFAALAPPQSPAWPDGIPGNASFASLAVQPGRMWLVGESVLAGVYPLEYSLARVQLDALEQDRGIAWAEEILGNTPRLWSVYQTHAKGQLESLLVLGVQNGHAAEGFLGDALDIVAAVAQSFSLKRGTVQKVKTLTVQWQGRRAGSVVIGFLPNTLVVAPSTASLQAHLTGASKPGTWMGGPSPSLAFGQGDSARLLGQLMDVLRVPHPAIPAMGQSVWHLAAAEKGWHAEVLGVP